MKKLLFFILLFFSLLFGDATTQASLPEGDSIQIYDWGNQAFNIRNTYSDSALVLANQALALSEKYGHKKSQVSLLRIKSLALTNQLQYDDAILNCEKALEIAGIIDYKVGTVSNTLANIYYNLEDFDSALMYYEKALVSGIQTKDTIAQIDALHNLGSVSTRNSKFKKSLDYFHRSLDLQREKAFFKIEIVTLNHLGWIYFKVNELSKAMRFFEEAIELANSRNDMKSLALVYYYMAKSYRDKGMVAESLESYTNTLELNEYISSKKLLELQKSIALFDLSTDDKKEVLRINKKILAIAQEEGDAIGKAKVHNYLANSFVRNNQLDSAHTHFKKSLKMCKQLDLNSWIFNPLNGMGQYFYKLNKSDSALYYFKEALKVDVLYDKERHKSELLTSIGKVYKHRSMNDDALMYFKDALVYAKRFGYKKIEAEINMHLYQVYEEKNVYVKAFQYLKQYQSLSDSLFGEDKRKQLANIKARYDFEKDRRELLAQSEKEKLAYDLRIKKQRIWIGLGSLIFFLSIIIAYFFFKYQRMQRNVEIEQERLLAEVKNQQLKMEKKERERLENIDAFKSKFFTDISHELRTPLSIIKGMNEKIKQQPEMWLDKGTEVVNESTSQMLNLVNQILVLQKLESDKLKMKFEQSNIMVLLKNIFYSFQFYADNKDLDLLFISEYNEIIMDHDPEKIRWVVSNLLSNAIKFTPFKGKIQLIVSKENKNLQLIVKDTGRGMSTQIQEKAFDRYFKTQDEINPQGSGIGLALTKELVNALDGAIELKSIVDQGTVVKVFLPITNTASFKIQEDVGVSAVRTNVFKNKGYTQKANVDLPYVLLVEDNDNMRILLQACLEQYYNVLVASDGQEGINVALKEVPDLIISDIMMPIKDGFTLCETLKKDEKTSHIPIVLLTAKADKVSKLEGLHKGADVYLSKPFDESELILRVNNLLKLRKVLQAKYSKVEKVYKSSTDQPDLEVDFLQKIRDYVLVHLEDEAFEIKDIYTSLYMSRSQFFRKVKALTGNSPSKYIRSIRLFEARQLIQNSELTITEVAFRVGFSSISYFSTCYFNEFQERPSETVA